LPEYLQVAFSGAIDLAAYFHGIFFFLGKQYQRGPEIDFGFWVHINSDSLNTI